MNFHSSKKLSRIIRKRKRKWSLLVSLVRQRLVTVSFTQLVIPLYKFSFILFCKFTLLPYAWCFKSAQPVVYLKTLKSIKIKLLNVLCTLHYLTMFYLLSIYKSDKPLNSAQNYLHVIGYTLLLSLRLICFFDASQTLDPINVIIEFSRSPLPGKLNNAYYHNSQFIY